MLNHIIAETIREYLSGQGRDGHTSTLAFKNVPEIFEIRVAASDSAVLQFESGNICSTDYLVIRIHIPRRAMCHRVLHLVDGRFSLAQDELTSSFVWSHKTDFYL